MSVHLFVCLFVFTAAVVKGYALLRSYMETLERLFEDPGVDTIPYSEYPKQFSYEEK